MKFLDYAGYFSMLLIVLQLLNEIRKLVSPIKSNFIFGKYFSWYQTDKFLNNIAKQINNSNIEYGLICGTGRGGGILASLLSYKLNLTPVLVMDRKYTVDQLHGKRSSICMEELIVLKDDFKELYNKPVLLITPQSDPGITLNKYVEVLKSSGFKSNIDKCAIIASKRTLDVDLKYVIKKYDPDSTCKKFPWEKHNPDLMDNPIHIVDNNTTTQKKP